MKVTNVASAIFLTAVLSFLAHGQETTQAEVSASSKANAAGTAEEKLLKTAYGKLMMYHKAIKARKARESNLPFNSDEAISFTLRNIHTGPIEEIHDRPYGELVSKPSGYILNVGRAVHSLNYGPETVSFSAQWTHSTYTGSVLEDWENTTIREVLRLLGPDYADIERYTSYEVTVRLDGRERTYRAMALHHGPQQSGAKPRMEFADNIVGTTALTQAFEEKRHPVRSKEKELDDPPKKIKKQSEDHLQDGEIGKGGLKQVRRGGALVGGREEDSEYGPQFEGIAVICDNMFCCVDDIYSCEPYSCAFTDPYWCGPITTPDPPPGACSYSQRIGVTNTRQSADNQYHFWGKHKAVTSLVNTCLIYQNCSVVCRVEIGSKEITDTGLVSSLCHQSGKSERFVDGFPSCQTTVGYGVKACFLCLCGVNIDVGPFKTTSDGFWTAEHTFGGSCSSDGTPSP